MGGIALPCRRAQSAYCGSALRSCARIGTVGSLRPSAWPSRLHPDAGDGGLSTGGARSSAPIIGGPEGRSVALVPVARRPIGHGVDVPPAASRAAQPQPDIRHRYVSARRRSSPRGRSRDRKSARERPRDHAPWYVRQNERDVRHRSPKPHETSRKPPKQRSLSRGVECPAPASRRAPIESAPAAQRLVKDLSWIALNALETPRREDGLNCLGKNHVHHLASLDPAQGLQNSRIDDGDRSPAVRPLDGQDVVGTQADELAGYGYLALNPFGGKTLEGACGDSS